MNSSPAQALRLILHGPAKAANQNIVVLDYRHSVTFSALWLQGLESGKVTIRDQPKIDLTDSNKQFLIIGNEPPDDIFNLKVPALAGINFKSHFTATSWLAAWKLKFSDSDKENEESETEKQPRVAVIDPSKAGSGSGVAQALQTIFSARVADGQFLVPGAAVFNSPSLGDICSWLKPSKPDERTTPNHLRELLKSTIWNELTSDREQHHALSNVLGPVILSGREVNTNCFSLDDDPQELSPDKAYDRVVLLLRQLLSATDQVSWKGIDTKNKETEALETGEGLDILLLDDQAEQGWSDWVKECLPDAVGRMQFAVDPKELTSTIKAALSVEGELKHKDARFSLNLPGLEGAKHPVLLLDLRLFSGNQKAENEFLKKDLLPLVNHFTDKDNLAWPGFTSSSDIFNRAKEAVQVGTLKPDTEEHHEVLTWLPRVVALADMSLPIVLFSSTGRRDLVEPFKPYGNIITSFEKPRLNDLKASSDADATRDNRVSVVSSLREALIRAKHWLNCRESAERINNVDMASLESARGAFAGKSHFEIYHDETKNVTSPHFRVTSLLAGFKDQEQAKQYDENFPIKFYGKGALKKNPYEDRWHDEKRRWSGNGRPKKGIYSQLQATFPPMLLSVAVRGDGIHDQVGDPDSLFDPNGLDNINWDLLSLQWECLLIDVLPTLLRKRSSDQLKQLSISVCGATRDRAVSLNAKTLADAVEEANDFQNALFEKWGLDVLPNCRLQDKDQRVGAKSDDDDLITPENGAEKENPPYKFLWKSLNSDSFWKIVAEALMGRKESIDCSWIAESLKQTCGYTLRYGHWRNDRDYGCRHLHYLADVAGELVDIAGGESRVSCNLEPFDDIGNRGMVSFRSRLLLLLNANRLLDLGDCISEAIAAFDGLDHDHPQDIAYVALAERLKKALNKVQGADLIRLSRLLSNSPKWLSGNRIQVPDRLARLKVRASKSQTRKRSPIGKTTDLDPAKDATSQVLSDERFDKLKTRWRLKRLGDGKDARDEASEWYDRYKEGYRVRVAKSGKISVFADLEKIDEDKLPQGFEKAEKNSFKAGGGLLGENWCPDKNLPPQSRKRNR